MKKFLASLFFLVYLCGWTTSDNAINFGDKSSSGTNQTIAARKNLSTTPAKLRYNVGSSLWDFSNDGTTFAPMVGTTLTQTLTNKTLTGNTAVNLISGSGTFVHNTTGTITAPNATDTLVGKATTDTLTNKTLTGNTAVNLISGSGTLTLNTTGTMTLPNATDTVVGKATTDTLTNKTLTTPTLTSPVFNTGVSGTAVDTDGTLAANSDTKLASQKATKTYVDTSVSALTGAPDSPEDRKNYSLTGTVASSALTITLKTRGGSTPSAGSPVTLSFRNSTLATGDYSVVSATGATTLVYPSGATAGFANGDTRYIYVYALNNAGTFELAASSRMLDENALHTTTTIDATSDSISGKYSTTARTSKSVRYLGKMLLTEATGGTWASAPSEISVGNQPKAATAMDDSEATRMGLKQYLCDKGSAGNDIAYNNSVKATVTATNLSAVDRCMLIPYQMQDGTWREKITISFSVSISTAGVNVTINGNTYKNTGGSLLQPGAERDGSGVAGSLRVTDGGTVLVFNGGGVATAYTGYLDVELDSQPTYAY